MRRAASRPARLASLAALAAAAGLATAHATAPQAEAARADPARMLVTASEFSYVLSRAKLPPGPALIELYNGGEDPHNLRIKRQGRKNRVWRIGSIQPGAVGEVEARLRRGRRYVLWCSLPAHRERGMEAKLRTRRRR